MTALAGHIKHIYEDLDLRFKDIKQIIKGLGYADFDVYEKVDGQNLFIGWDFEKNCLKVARNKQNIKDGGLDRYGISLKFGDRPEIEKLFLSAYDALSKGFEVLDAKSKKTDYNIRIQIFGSLGSIWYPIEIINPELPNTIHYNSKFIIFHEYSPTLFGFNGEPITKGLPRNMKILKQVLPTIDGNIEGWKIVAPHCFPYKPIDDSIINNACGKIEQICKRANVSDSTTLRAYVSAHINDDMQRFPLVPHHIRNGLAKSLIKMTGAPKTKDLLASLDKQTKQYAKSMIEEEKNIVIPKLLAPIEKVIHDFSSTLLSFSNSEYIANPEQESKRLRNEYNKCADSIRNGSDLKKQKLLKEMNPKIGIGIITMEGLVFKYKDKLFKITGAFAPMNRVIASIKYENIAKKHNKADIPLSMFVNCG